MAQQRHIQTNWTAGEISPLLYGRVDIDRYPNGAAEVLNGVILPYGGVTRRPGSYFVATAKNSNVRSKLRHFKASTFAAYVVEFGNSYCRFHTNRGRLESGGIPVELALPYTTADLDGLRFAQSGDTLFIVHKNYPPRVVRRTSAAEFDTREVLFENGPWQNVNITDTTIQVSAAGTLGDITATASTGIFAATDVGRFLAMFDETQLRVASTAYTKGDTFHTSRQDINRVWRVVLAGTTAALDASGTTPTYDKNSPIDEGDYVKDGTARLQYLGRGKSVWGWGTISGYTSPTVVTLTVTEAFAPGAADQPETEGGGRRPRNTTTIPTTIASVGTVHWKLGAWGGTNGYPRTVCFYQQRTWWGGSASAPQTIWSSQSGDFYNMAPTEPDGIVLDTNAIVYGMDDDEANAILWMLPVWRGISLGTAGGEHVLGASSSANQAVGPTNIHIRRASDRGSGQIVPALRAGMAAMFVQRGGRKLREMAYDFGQDAFATPPASLISEHITGTGVVDIALQEEPDGTLWLAREDGAAASLTYDKEQQVRGWSGHEIGGDIESLAINTSPDGKSDDVYLAVKRTINGNVVRYIEVIRAPFRSMIDGENGGFFVDCGLTYDGTAATTFTGLDHLEGATVQICGDGAYRGTTVVSGGAVTIAAPAASLVHIGLSSEFRVTALPVEAGAQGGSAQGAMKKTTDAFVRLFESRGGEIGIDGRYERIQMRAPQDDVNAALPLFSGVKRIDPVPLQWDRESVVIIRQTEPLPITVLNLVRVVTTHG